MSGMWSASRKPKQEADSLAHWGLNTAKFLYEAGPPQGAPGAAGGAEAGAGAAALGRMLLVEGGYMPLTAALLAAAGAGEEVPQGMMLTPQVRRWAGGGGRAAWPECGTGVGGRAGRGTGSVGAAEAVSCGDTGRWVAPAGTNGAWPYTQL